MNWLEFGRAMSAIIVTSGAMWIFVDPSTPRLSAQNFLILAMFVLVLLGLLTAVEFLRNVGVSVSVTDDESSDDGLPSDQTMSELIDLIDENENATASESDREQEP